MSESSIRKTSSSRTFIRTVVVTIGASALLGAGMVTAASPAHAEYKREIGSSSPIPPQSDVSAWRLGLELGYNEATRATGNGWASCGSAPTKLRHALSGVILFGLKRGAAHPVVGGTEVALWTADGVCNWIQVD